MGLLVLHVELDATCGLMSIVVSLAYHGQIVAVDKFLTTLAALMTDRTSGHGNDMWLQIDQWLSGGSMVAATIGKLPYGPNTPPPVWHEQQIPYLEPFVREWEAGGIWTPTFEGFLPPKNLGAEGWHSCETVHHMAAAASLFRSHTESEQQMPSKHSRQ